MQIERKKEVEMVCYLSDLAWLVSGGHLDISGVEIWPRDEFAKSSLQKQYLDLRQLCFPLVADDEQFEMKDSQIEWISFVERGGCLVSSAETICTFDAKRCTLENVMTRPDCRERGLGRRVSAAVLMHMHTTQRYDTASLSCMPEHVSIYEALDFQPRFPKRPTRVAMAG